MVIFFIAINRPQTIAIGIYYNLLQFIGINRPLTASIRILAKPQCKSLYSQVVIKSFGKWMFICLEV